MSGRTSGIRQAREPKPSTKDLLITTSEQLFGRSGINGVSLREIGAAAGQTNSNVVQYHFGDKRGLVLAIVSDRFRKLESARVERLRLLTEHETTHRPREALRLLWEPVMSVKGVDGDHTFCRFLLQYLLQPQGPEHPSRSRTPPPELPALRKIRQLLRRHYRELSMTAFNARLAALSMLFLSAVVEHDNARLLATNLSDRPFDLEPILDMAVAALAAPVTRRGR